MSRRPSEVATWLWPGPRPFTQATALAYEGTLPGSWEAVTFDVSAACRAVYLVHAAAWQSQVLDRHARRIRRRPRHRR